MTRKSFEGPLRGATFGPCFVFRTSGFLAKTDEFVPREHVRALHSLKLRNHVGFSASDLGGYLISGAMPTGDASGRERPKARAVFRASYFDSVFMVGAPCVLYSAPGALG